jgi:energy-coupling factor transport system substrate-specific component
MKLILAASQRPRTPTLSLAGLASVLTYVLISLIGAAAFLYPFWSFAAQPGSSAAAHNNDAPLMTALLIGLCLIALVLDAQQNNLNIKRIALLGVLVAINSVLRFAEVGIPGPGGFTPIFFLIIVSGCVFGGRFGLLMGTLSMLASALITGGVGPWLPYQMFTAGWMGLSSGWLATFLTALRGEADRANPRFEHGALIAFGAAWGFAYGAIMNVWFWPFTLGAVDNSWQTGLTLSEALQRYTAFYAVTSLGWDVFAAAGNAMMLAFFAVPAMRSMQRFKARFSYDVVAP